MGFGRGCELLQNQFVKNPKNSVTEKQPEGCFSYAIGHNDKNHSIAEFRVNFVGTPSIYIKINNIAKNTNAIKLFMLFWTFFIF